MEEKNIENSYSIFMECIVEKYTWDHLKNIYMYCFQSVSPFTDWDPSKLATKWIYRKQFLFIYFCYQNRKHIKRQEGKLCLGKKLRRYLSTMSWSSPYLQEVVAQPRNSLFLWCIQIKRNSLLSYQHPQTHQNHKNFSLLAQL